MLHLRVWLKFPKFKIACEVNLKERMLGIQDTFDEGTADFSAKSVDA